MAYRSNVAERSTQPTPEHCSNDERTSIVRPPPFNPFPGPKPFPWPWPGPGPRNPTGGERDTADSAALTAVSDPELLKRIYCKPEYRAVIQLFGSALLERLEADPEALQAFKEFLKAQDVDLDQQERFIPILIGIAVGASFFGGCTIGYYAEKGKAGGKK